MTKPTPTDDIRPVSFVDALSERYLAYAMSTITSRSLPDVRDGLKPVHRRLLYAMHQLGLNPNAGFKKCARVVGDVIGKYHPHGDVAVYDAMVRLAQTFALRYPLVEGQGNFGSIDGDNPAAMRYTEARLTEVALLMLEGLEEDTVDFRPTYDNTEEEPIVLPGAFPNLLANGSEGIAVGMATSIPPHNIVELCAALSHLIAHPDADTETVIEYIHGPDFPTGGVIVNTREEIRQAYRTGRGSFRVRARWEKENLSHGLYQVIITEIPYQVPKSRLIEKIAELFRDKKLPLLANIRDESTDTVRVVLEPRSRTVPAETLMESLYRVSELESRFALNLNVLTGGMPKVQGIHEVLNDFLAHRLELLVRRSQHRLAKIAHRLEVLGGLLIAYLNLDEVIRIIREEDEPKAVMIARFDLTDIQAEAILNMRLRSLRKLEEFEIRKEHDALSRERDELNALLESESKQRKTIGREIAVLAKRFGPETPLGARRTTFGETPPAEIISIEAFVEKEPVTLLCSRLGWVRALKGHVADLSEIKYKDGDEPLFALHAKTTDKIVFFASDGKFYTLLADRFPKGKGFGEPLRLLFDLAADAEAVEMLVHQPGAKLLVASSAGRGFVVEEDAVLAQTKAGKQVLSVGDGARAVACKRIAGDMVAVVGENRRMIVFALEEVPEMRRGQGVTLQKYKGGGLADLTLFAREEGLSWKSGERTRSERDLRLWTAKRGGIGHMAPVGFPRSNRFN